MNIKLYKISALIFLVFITNPSLIYSQTKQYQDYQNLFGESYFSFSGFRTYAFNKVTFADPNIVLATESKSFKNDFDLGVNILIFKDYFATVKVGRTSIYGYFEHNSGIPNNSMANGFKIRYLTANIGVSRHYGIGVKNLYCTVNPNILLIRTLSSEHGLFLTNLNEKFFSKHHWAFGFNLTTELEYIFGKRYALFIKGKYNHILNDNAFMKHTISYKDLGLGTETIYLQEHIKPKFFNFGFGLKIALEHRTFYKK
ncbi:MAG TPA: hypothetical protein PKX92_13855 [Edaphocola sp.]|nr:hypothetical protein [Edaphocola sp.]